MLHFSTTRTYILLMFVVPLLLHRHFGASSLSAGIILLSGSYLLTASIFFGAFSRSSLRGSFALLLLLLVSSLFAILNFPYTNPARTISTAIVYPLAVLTAADLIRRSSPQDFSLAFYVLLASQVISTPLAALGYFPSRSSLLFNEPSHFGLAILPLFIIQVLTQKSSRGTVISLAAYSFCLTQFLGIITLITLAIASIMYGLKQNKIFAPAAIIAIGVAIYALYSHNSTYFDARIDLSNDRNASVLAFLAGYERLWDIWKSGHYFGVGLQNFGNHPINSASFDILFEIDGRVNLHGGSVTFAKLGAEFGPIALIFPLLLATIVTSLIRNLSNVNPITLAFSLAALIELLLRGLGYFSPSFLFGTAIALGLANVKAGKQGSCIRNRPGEY